MAAGVRSFDAVAAAVRFIINLFGSIGSPALIEFRELKAETGRWIRSSRVLRYNKSLRFPYNARARWNLFCTGVAKSIYIEYTLHLV